MVVIAFFSSPDKFQLHVLAVLFDTYPDMLRFGANYTVSYFSKSCKYFVFLRFQKPCVAWLFQRLI